MNAEILILILIIVLMLLRCHYYKLQLKRKDLKYIYLRKKLNEERLNYTYYKNEMYKFKLSNDSQNKWLINNKDVKYAIKYAMKCSHPDNGGSAEDFQKFKKLYDKL